jgi:CheY-like chemotaxis protein
MAQINDGFLSTDPYALVVDDDALVLMTSCDILEEAGFRFYEAGSGDEAKSVLEESGDAITLLFTDVEMPGETNGFELAHYAAQNWPDIEIVIASGRIAPRPGDMPAKATFISKPFSIEIVHDHLRRTLPDGKQPEPLKQAI